MITARAMVGDPFSDVVAQSIGGSHYVRICMRMLIVCVTPLRNCCESKLPAACVGRQVFGASEHQNKHARTHFFGNFAVARAPQCKSFRKHNLYNRDSDLQAAVDEVIEEHPPPDEEEEEDTEQDKEEQAPNHGAQRRIFRRTHTHTLLTWV